MIHVVVGIIVNSAEEILIAQRPDHKYCPGLWEFPGGKVERNEKAQDALTREFLEEVGIQVISAQPWFQVQHDYGDRIVKLDIWQILEFQGEPHGAEGQSILWVKPSQLNQFEFPAGNRAIIQKLIVNDFN